MTQTDGTIKKKERRWQDLRGGTLQHTSYGRPGTRVVLDWQFSRIAEALRLESNMRVLDLGCGVGHLLSWFTMPGRYHGLDLSLVSLRSARAAKPSLRLALGDAEQLPYRDDCFHRIVCNGSAHHFVDKHSAFREMYRVLAPGGRLVLFEPTATLVTSALRRLLPNADQYESPVDLAHKDDFTAGRARALLREAGFTDVTASLHDFLAYPLSGNYVGSPLGKSRAVMGLLCRLERSLTRVTPLKPLLNLFAWRLLVVSGKPNPRATA
jgi:SAM-dependent methyltransferase